MPITQSVLLGRKEKITKGIAIAKTLHESIQGIKALVAALFIYGSSDYYLIRDDILCKFENWKGIFMVTEEVQWEIIRKINECGHFAVSKLEDLVK